MPPVVAALAVEAGQDQQAQPVPAADELKLGQTVAASVEEQDNAMQLDPHPDTLQPTPATQPVVEVTVEIEGQRQQVPQEAASVPAPAPTPAPEPPAPPRRVSFMAYKQRASTGTAAVPKASPSSSSVEVPVIPEESEAASASASGPATNLPAQASSSESARLPGQEMQIDIPSAINTDNGNILDQALVQTPMVEKPESVLSVPATPSVADEPSPAQKTEAEVFVAPAVVPAAPPPPMPRARLSFAAYRQRLSTTPASPSEASASSTTTPAATPAGGMQDEEKKLETALSAANDQSPLPQAKAPEKKVERDEKDDSPAKTNEAPPEVVAPAEKTALVNIERPEVPASKDPVEGPSVEMPETPVQTATIPAGPTPPAVAERKPEAFIDAVHEEGEVTMDTSVEAGEVLNAPAPAPATSREPDTTNEMAVDDKSEQTRPNERSHSATPPPREARRSSPVEAASAKIETEARAVPTESKASRADESASTGQVPSQPSARPSRWSNAVSPASSYASLPSSHQAVQRDSLPPLSPPSGPRNLPTGPRSGSAAPVSAAAAVAPNRGRGAGRGAYHGRGIPSGGPSPPSRDAYNDGKSSYGRSGGSLAPPVGPRVDRDPPSAPRAFQQGPPSGRGRGNYAGGGSRFDGVPSGPASMLPRDRGWGPRGGSGSGGGRGGYRGGRGGSSNREYRERDRD